MKYEVRCECGKKYPIGAADAGTTLRCPCKRNVEVPPLHILRASTGGQAVSPVIQIQAMLHKNELPGTRDCANCGCRTDHLIRVSVVCERVSTKSRPTASGESVFGFLVLGLSEQETVAHGHDVSFVLPVRVCETCASDQPDALRRDLNATPAYAALLRKYPNATVTRVS